MADAQIQVFTFKDGVLSVVAHDLRLSIGKHRVRYQGGRIEVSLWLDSLAVDGVMRNGRLDPLGLSDSQKNEVLKHALGEVLDVKRYPVSSFAAEVQSSAMGKFRLDGRLQLHGQEHEVRVAAERFGERVCGEAELVPSTWGIRPYRAMLGALKLQDRVVVRFELPVPPVESAG